jgi:hypothetical protein
VTRDWDEVFRTEDTGLLKDAAKDFSECEAVLRRVESLDAASLLHWLEGYAAHGWLSECEFDYVAEFLIVDAAGDADDKRGGDAKLVETLDGFLANSAHISAAGGDA